MSGKKGFGRYLSDDHRVAAALRAKKAQLERDERRREHENEMALKRSKLEADRQAEQSNAQAELDAGRQVGGGSPLKSTQERESAGRGFGKYLDR